MGRPDVTRSFFRNSIILFFLCSTFSYAAQTNNLNTIAASHRHVHDMAAAHQQSISKGLAVARMEGAHTTGQLVAKCTKDSCKNKPDKTGVWVQPLGLIVRQKNNGSTPGFKSRTGALLVGVDSKIKEGLILGGALGYGSAVMSFNLNAGKSHVYDSFLTLFGTWFGDIWYTEASLLGGLQKYRVARNTGTNNLFVFNHHRGYQISPHLGGGYIFSRREYQLRPYATADYAYSSQTGHLDTGPGAPSIYIEKSDSSMLRLEGGFNLSKKSDHEKFYSKLSLQLAVVNKRPLKRGSIIASNGLTYQTTKKAATAFSPGLEAFLSFDDGYSLSAFWVGEYATQYTQQEIFIKFRKTL